jgi:hypothetical protein
LVSGVSYRQDALRSAGEGTHLFRFVCEPTNQHDSEAVAIYCASEHIGYVSAKIAPRYGEAVRRIEAGGAELWVHGSIEVNELGLLARIDCPWPEDI